MTDGVDIDGLRKLYSANPVARAFLDHAAGRERDRGETTVERTQTILRREGKEASRGEIVDLFQAFEQLGCGKFVVGRWNHRSRFAWNVGIVSVGKAAAGEEQTISAIQESEPESQDEGEVLNHTYHLRPELCISIDLPVDLSSKEATRLADFIRTLPMYGEDET